MIRELNDMGNEVVEFVNRLAGNEVLAAKIIKKFKTDRTFSQLKNSIVEENKIQAYRNLHTLKGVSANLGLTRLASECLQMQLIIRKEASDHTIDAFNRLEEEYRVVIQTLEKFE